MIFNPRPCYGPEIEWESRSPSLPLLLATLLREMILIIFEN